MKQKPIKVKLVYQPNSFEEAKFRLLRAFEVLLPRDKIIEYLESSKKANRKSKHYLRNNEKYKLKKGEFISHK
jgi:hypothetical protein